MTYLQNYIIITELASSTDMKNGAVSRLNAWRKVLPNIIIVSPDENITSLHNKKISAICIDVTGLDSGGIIKYWLAYRHHSPIIFMQDSGTRYWSSKLLFDFSHKKSITLKPLLNTLRSWFREALAHILFRKVGYISHIDCNYIGLNGYCIGVTYPLTESWIKHQRRAINRTTRTFSVIANFTYHPNIESALHIFSDIDFINNLRKMHCKFAFNGLGSEDLIRRLPKEILTNIDIDNSGEFNDIEDILSKSDAVILATLYGAGVKNRAIEAFNSQKPCFIWSGFRNEYPYDPTFSIYYDDANSLGIILTKIQSIESTFGPQETYKWKSQLELINFFETK